MSGGVAYVLDLDQGRVNHGLVELAPVSAEEAAELESVVRRHSEETGSTVAAALLEDWAAALPRFTQVIPTEFRKVLHARNTAEAEGLDEDATTAAMMEALDG
jgi:glutamate synthase (NADPH/NADH) large chain